MPRYTGDGTGSYVPNTVSPSTPPRPTSYPSRSLSIYSRPSAAVMYADMSAANAMNQRLIQEAMERARQHAEEMRRLAEERARQQAELERQRQEQQARLARDFAEDQPVMRSGVGAYQGPGLDPRAGIGATQGTVNINAGDINLPGVAYSENFRTDNIELAQKMARDRGLEVKAYPGGMYGIGPIEERGQRPTYAPGSLVDVRRRSTPPDPTVEGWRNGGLFSSTKAAANARERYATWRDETKSLMEQGGPNFRELADRFVGPNGENLDMLFYQAQVDVWGEPEPIIEKVPTGRYETVKDANGKVVSSTPIYEERIVGYDWSYSTDASMVDPTTGEVIDRRGYGRPIEYLGVPRGYIAVNLPKQPKPDADMSEWKAYYNALKNSVAKPIYTTESPLQTLQRMDTKQRAQLQRQMINANLFEPDAMIVPGQLDRQFIEKFGELMGDANARGITWEKNLEQWTQFAAEMDARNASGGYGGGGGGGGGDTVYKQIQYNQTSVAQARSLLIGVLTEALGRYPTDDEVQRFLSMLNKQEKKSPSKTVTRTSTDGSNTTSVTRMTPSTVDAQALAEEFARSLEGYDENAMDRYMNALFESLGEARV